MTERSIKKDPRYYKSDSDFGELLLRLGNATDLTDPTNNPRITQPWKTPQGEICEIKATQVEDLEGELTGNRTSMNFVQYVLSVTPQIGNTLEFLVESENKNISLYHNDKKARYARRLNTPRTLELIKYLKSFDEDAALKARGEDWGTDENGNPITVAKIREQFDAIVKSNK